MLEGSKAKHSIADMVLSACREILETSTAPKEEVSPKCPLKRSATLQAPGRHNGGRRRPVEAANDTEHSSPRPGVHTHREGGLSDGAK